MGYYIVSVNVYKVTHGNHPHLSANPNRIVPGESKLGFVVDFDGLRIESMKTNSFRKDAPYTCPVILSAHPA
jgi:hypothetical protein